MRRILSFAVFLFVLFLLAVPMPSRSAPPGTPVLQSEVTRAVSPTSIRLGAVIVNHLLPATAGAQTTTTAPEGSHGHSAFFWIVVVAFVILLAAAAWKFGSKYMSSSTGTTGSSGNANKRAT